MSVINSVCKMSYLANMPRPLHMRHLCVNLQRVQKRKRLAAILARMLEIPLVHTLHVHGQGARTGQHFAALRAWI